MPRIRTIKPDIHQHRKVGPLSDRQFRVFVGLITQADDEGRFVADPEFLRATLFPYHARVRAREVQSALDDLAGAGLIQLYEAAGDPYGALPGWNHHQRIHKHHFMPSKIPAPDDLGTNTVPVPQARGIGPAGSEGNGKERKGWKGPEGSVPEKSSLSADTAEPQRGDYAAVVERLGARVKGGPP